MGGALAMDQALAPPSLGMGFLNLHWILQGVDAMLAAHADLQRLLLSLEIPGRKDRNLVSVFVDDNARQLETINAVRKGMAVAGQHKMRIKYALNLVKSAASSREELEVTRAKIYLEGVIGEIEANNGVKNTHTGSWPLDEGSDDRRHSRKLKLEKKSKMSTIASKVIEANLVSSLVLAALLAALDCSGVQSLSITPAIPKNLLGGLWEELKEEAEARRGKHCSSALLEGICSCLRQIASVLDSLLRKDEGVELQIKQLLQLSHKKLDYLDSGFQILEEQMSDLFSKMVANRKKILSIA